MNYKITNNFSSSVNKVWNELVKLDYFLRNKFIDWMNKQVDLNPENWKFIHEPMKIIEQEKFNLPKELYEYSYETIFIQNLLGGFNNSLELSRELIKVRKRKEFDKEKMILEETNRVIKGTIENYSKNVFKFREIANKFVLRNSQENHDTNYDNLVTKKSDLKLLLSKGEIGKSFRILFNLLKNDDEKYNQIVNLSSRLSRNEMDYRMGTISDESKNIEYSKICNGLLKLIDEL